MSALASSLQALRRDGTKMAEGERQAAPGRPGPNPSPLGLLGCGRSQPEWGAPGGGRGAAGWLVGQRPTGRPLRPGLCAILQALPAGLLPPPRPRAWPAWGAVPPPQSPAAPTSLAALPRVSVSGRVYGEKLARGWAQPFIKKKKRRVGDATDITPSSRRDDGWTRGLLLGRRGRTWET